MACELLGAGAGFSLQLAKAEAARAVLRTHYLEVCGTDVARGGRRWTVAETIAFPSPDASLRVSTSVSVSVCVCVHRCRKCVHRRCRMNWRTSNPRMRCAYCQLLTHTLSHSLTHTLTHTLTHPRTHALTHSLLQVDAVVNDSLPPTAEKEPSA